MSCENGTCGIDCSCKKNPRRYGAPKQCDGKCESWETRLAELRAHEPGCFAALMSACGDKPILKHKDCKRIARELVALCIAKLAKTDDGPALVFPRSEVDSKNPCERKPYMVLVADLCHCPLFNAAFNCERRDSLLSPSRLDAIANAYGREPITAGPALNVIVNGVSLIALPGGGGWYGVLIAPLGLSHTFCLESFTASISVTIPEVATVAAVPALIGLSGETIACGDGSPGFPATDYVRVWDQPGQGEYITPEGLTVVAGTCRPCKRACAWTPGRGGEAIWFQLTPADAALVAAGGLLRVSLVLSRCDWGSGNPKGCCVDILGSRLPSIGPAYTGGIRVTASVGVFLPGLGGI